MKWYWQTYCPRCNYRSWAGQEYTYEITVEMHPFFVAEMVKESPVTEEESEEEGDDNGFLECESEGWAE